MERDSLFAPKAFEVASIEGAEYDGHQRIEKQYEPQPISFANGSLNDSIFWATDFKLTLDQACHGHRIDPQITHGTFDETLPAYLEHNSMSISLACPGISRIIRKNAFINFIMLRFRIFDRPY